MQQVLWWKRIVMHFQIIHSELCMVCSELSQKTESLISNLPNLWISLVPKETRVRLVSQCIVQLYYHSISQQHKENAWGSHTLSINISFYIYKTHGSHSLCAKLDFSTKFSLLARSPCCIFGMSKWMKEVKKLCGIKKAQCKGAFVARFKLWLSHLISHWRHINTHTHREKSKENLL